METSIRKQDNGKRAFLIALSSIFALTGVVCFIFHLSPRELFHALAEYSEHHYLLVSFICLAVAFISYKFYSEQRSGNKHVSPSFLSPARKRRELKVLLRNLQRSINTATYNGPVGFVDKEKIGSIQFDNREELRSSEEKQLRQEILEKALILGNTYKQKVFIYFRAEGQDLYTLATIWHVDSENICIKGGAIIPVKSIYKIKL